MMGCGVMGCTPMVFRRRVERRMRAGRTGLRQATRHHGTQTGADSPRGRGNFERRMRAGRTGLRQATRHHGTQTGADSRRSLRPRKTLSLREDPARSSRPLTVTPPHLHTPHLPYRRELPMLQKPPTPKANAATKSAPMTPRRTQMRC